MDIQQMKDELIEELSSEKDIIALEYLLEEKAEEWLRGKTREIKVAIEEALLKNRDWICLIIKTDDIICTRGFNGEKHYGGSITSIIGRNLVSQMGLLDRIEAGISKKSRDEVNFNLFFEALIKKIVGQLNTELLGYSYFNGNYFVKVRI
jgi:hypothetical protein